MTTGNKAPRVFNSAEIPAYDRGAGVVTRLMCSESRCGAGVTTGTTTLPVGRSVQMHSHNCDEQILILQGQAEAEFDGAAILSARWKWRLFRKALCIVFTTSEANRF